MDRDLLDIRAHLNNEMYEHGNIEKICNMTQELIVKKNTKLNELAQAIDEANSTKTRLRVEAQNQNHQREETGNPITILSKNKMTLNAKLEDARRLAEAKTQDQANLIVG